MKILYYCTAYHSNHGGSRHAQAFVTSCQAISAVKEIVVFPGVDEKKNAIRQSSWKLKLKQSPFFLALSFYRVNQFYLNKLFEKIEAFRPDVLHIRLEANFLQIPKIKKRYPKLLITTEVNASPFDESFGRIAFKNYFRNLEANILARVDRNYFVTHYLAKMIMGAGISQVRDIINPNGVDVELFEKKIKAEESPLKIGYIGTIDYHKQVNVLVAAYRLLKEKYPHIRLEITGDGPALNQIKNQSKVADIDFKGWVAYPDIPAILRDLDIAVHHCALEYMSPLKMLEYMAARVPTIGPDTAGVKELFEDGMHFVGTTGEVQDLAEKLSLLIEDEILRQRLSNNAYELVRQKYSWQANALRYINHTKELLA